MKTAIVAVTRRGAVLADKLSKQLGDAIVFAKNGHNTADTDEVFEHLSPLVKMLFTDYKGIVFIMSTGIVVRVIAPFIRDKRVDPAIVVMDDGGRHAISLLSGHIGGANDLALAVAAAVAARPVITTATDTAGLPAADVLAVKLGLAIEPFGNMKGINAAIVAGEKAEFFVDDTLDGYEQYLAQAAALGIELSDMRNALRQDEYDCAVLITAKTMDIKKPHVYLRPHTKN